MKVVILCGGLGTRLREETEYRPKPMVPVGGRPILWHIMKNYAAQGHKEFILCLGYKGEVIRDFFRNYQWNTSDVTLKLGSSPQITYHTQHDEEDWTVTLLETGEDTMTGGRLKRALPYVGEGTFLFTYGDGVADVDVNAAVAGHRKNGSLATIIAVRPAGRFGDIVIEGGRVSRFHEKPPPFYEPFDKIVRNLSVDGIVDAMKLDKKASGGRLACILTHGPGAMEKVELESPNEARYLLGEFMNTLS